MSAYIVAIFECHSREEAEAAAESADLGGHAFASVATEIHDTPPVVLAGLVRGGEYASVEEWLNSGSETLCIAADGRIVGTEDSNDAVAAEARGALPITWYRYPEEV